jgi:hypothetical protein
LIELRIYLNYNSKASSLAAKVTVCVTNKMKQPHCMNWN